MITEYIYPNSLMLQAIRNSLKGKARDILLTAGSLSSPSDILNKLEGIYGNVSSEMFMHKADATVADFSIRIEFI